MQSIEVLILSHNRPELVARSLCSVLRAVDYFGCRTRVDVTVSDNSTPSMKKAVIEALAGVKGAFNFRSSEEGTSFTHTADCIHLTEADYIILFHDDDVMERDYFVRMAPVLGLPNIVAFATNSISIDLNGVEINGSAPSFKADGEHVRLTSPLDLVERYINRELGIAPYPSYCYRSSVVKDIFGQLKDIGPQTDVLFLLRLFGYGDVLWLSQPLMRYCVHEVQGSHQVCIRSLSRMRREFLRSGLSRKNEVYKRYRLKHWREWYLTQRDSGTFVFRANTLMERVARYQMLKADLLKPWRLSILRGALGVGLDSWMNIQKGNKLL